MAVGERRAARPRELSLAIPRGSRPDRRGLRRRGADRHDAAPRPGRDRRQPPLRIARARQRARLARGLHPGDRRLGLRDRSADPPGLPRPRGPRRVGRRAGGCPGLEAPEAPQPLPQADPDRARAGGPSARPGPGRDRRFGGPGDRRRVRPRPERPRGPDAGRQPDRPRPPLQGHPVPRQGRPGRGQQGPRRGAAPRGRPQGDPVGLRRSPRVPRAVPPRGRGDRPARTSRDRPRLRDRPPRRRPPLLHHAVHPGRDPQGGHRPAPSDGQDSGPGAEGPPEI